MFKPDIVATTHGWECRYTPTIMSGPVFRWSRGSATRGDLEVSAGREGVCVSGYGDPMKTAGPFIAVVQLAERVHVHLDRNDRDTDGARAIIRAAEQPPETP